MQRFLFDGVKEYNVFNEWLKFYDGKKQSTDILKPLKQTHPMVEYEKKKKTMQGQTTRH